MRLLRFTFKNEAIWMILFYFGLIGIGVLIAFIVWVARSF